MTSNAMTGHKSGKGKTYPSFPANLGDAMNKYFLKPEYDQDLLQRSRAGFDLHWNSSLAKYYYRCLFF